MPGHRPWREIRHKAAPRRSPDVRGRRVEIAPASDPHPNEIGVVVDQVTWQFCASKPANDRCGYDTLIIELPSGERTRLYEPEADPVADPQPTA
jgi:hypothetical protein